ncbi:hypothetical protein RRG08_002571 [Elysia crispata]|uniref:Uncharacterized protein n=1 Tax=Elysia crispata TaxID=231223 RepID=A0AAE0Y525_9GAST|nr:hypothetical protein RRG08_002571 [Elysia crispata]
MSYEEEDDGQIPEPTPKTGGSNAVQNFFMNLKPKKNKKAAPQREKKSHTQYQAEYRQRLREDVKKWSLYCSKQKVRVRNWRNNLTEELSHDKVANSH